MVHVGTATSAGSTNLPQNQNEIGHNQRYLLMTVDCPETEVPPISLSLLLAIKPRIVRPRRGRRRSERRQHTVPPASWSLEPQSSGALGCWGKRSFQSNTNFEF
jgi:hypothetical protein